MLKPFYKLMCGVLILVCLCSCSGEASTSVPSSVQPVSASSVPSSIAAIQGDSSSTSMPETGSSSSQIWQEEDPDLSYDEYFSEERKVEHLKLEGLPSADTTSKFGVNYLRDSDEKIIYYRDTIKSLTPNAVTNFYFAKNRYLYYAEKGKGLYVYDDKTQEHEFVFEFGGNVDSFSGDDKAVYFLDADTYMVYRLYRPTGTVDEMCIIPEEDRATFGEAVRSNTNTTFVWSVPIPGDYTGRSGVSRYPMYDARTKTISVAPEDFTFWLY